ncbi:DUF3299 domain-containing protein [Alteromonas oceanisediminis]|uniref:DUF3299 domain-containing protein n=1 Tax=Alteromonas oceanisediminis TaxID=2836180 RepID=UPI002023ADBA|nr:DUF3299 domain-containing protein [Alteromonas oceanisediminis]
MSGKKRRGYRQALSVAWLAMGLLLTCATMADDGDYAEIEWVELMPQDDLEALMNMPDIISEIEDGSARDSVDSLTDLAQESAAAKRFKEALNSTRVIESFDNRRIRIPGFMVPLQADEQHRVTEFFIVPYFGACLHMPPPPPNQIIYGRVEQGFELDHLDLPLWFEGTLSLELNRNSTGASAYSMALDNIQLYE